MTETYDKVQKFLLGEVASLTSTSLSSITPDTALVGTHRVVDSADLVMLLLSAEEYASAELGVVFDWKSDSAMSEARSTLRNIGSLARHLTDLQTP